MHKLITTLSLFLFFMTCSIVCAAQQEVDMADVMRANGKIYVVVAVLAVLFAGLFGYLIAIDRKISRFEKEERSDRSV